MSTIKEVLKDKTIISYGGYDYFNKHIGKLEEKIKIDYVCVNKKSDNLDKYNYISEEEILKLSDPFVIISLAKTDDVRKAAVWCQKNDIPFSHLSFMIDDNRIFGSEYLQAIGGSYTDFFNNHIEISPMANGEIVVNTTEAHDSNVYIGAIRVYQKLHVAMFGKGGKFSVNDGTSMGRVSALVNSNGEIRIGKDCMFSHSIQIMESDMHMIFDMNTRKRINYPKPIIIGDHVWVGREVEILGGANIGDNSVIGARAVTSGHSPPHVIIAGCPAKIIREDIIWTKDLIKNPSIDNFEDTKDKQALKYMPQKD